MRTALDWNPQENRKRIRPKITWKRTVVSRAARKEWKEVKALASNRVRWRLLWMLYAPSRSRTHVMMMMMMSTSNKDHSKRMEGSEGSCKQPSSVTTIVNVLYSLAEWDTNDDEYNEYALSTSNNAGQSSAIE